MNQIMRKLRFWIIYTLGVMIISSLATLLLTVIIHGANTKRAEEINSQVVLDRIEEQAFLVTKTIYLDEQVNIKVDQGSDWSNFFWGKEVTAEGLVRVDYGIDFDRLDSSDISINPNDSMITIKAKKPQVLDASLTNDLEIKDGSAILRRIFASDPNEDYKLAQKVLTDSARKSLSSEQKLNEKTVDSTEQLLNYLFQDFDYGIKLQLE